MVFDREPHAAGTHAEAGLPFRMQGPVDLAEEVDIRCAIDLVAPCRAGSAVVVDEAAPPLPQRIAVDADRPVERQAVGLHRMRPAHRRAVEIQRGVISRPGGQALAEIGDEVLDHPGFAGAELLDADADRHHSRDQECCK